MANRSGSWLHDRKFCYNYRILYFFHGRTAAILAHGLAKESVVPTKEIDLAVRRSRLYSQDPKAHQYREEIGNGEEDDQ
jgi:phage-related protein